MVKAVPDLESPTFCSVFLLCPHREQHRQGLRSEAGAWVQATCGSRKSRRWEVTHPLFLTSCPFLQGTLSM